MSPEMTLDRLPTPALVVDLDRLERNLERMQRHAEELGVHLRPHVKTHKCVEIGRMQVDAGARGITVATPFEARAFADAGFDDLTWAFPLIPSRMSEVLDLTDRVRLGVVVDAPAAVEVLAASGRRLPVWIKVDCGYHRAGVGPDTDAPERLATAIVDGGLELAGLLSHSGDAYVKGQRSAAVQRERDVITVLAGRLREAGFEVPDVSVGSTPGITAARDLEGVTEARPGNYAYFDMTQVDLGSCKLTDCALTVVSTVVSTAPDHAVCDAGALALSQDRGSGERDSMGEIYANYEAGSLHDDLRVISLSQEHGKLARQLPWGTRIRILPNHSCLTAACFPWVHVARGDRVVARWRIHNGR